MLIRLIAFIVSLLVFAIPANAFEFGNLYAEAELGGISLVRSHDDGQTKRDAFLAPSIGFGYQQSRSFRYGVDFSYYSNAYPAEYLYIFETEKSFRTTLKLEAGIPITRDFSFWAGAGFISEFGGFTDRVTMTDDGYLDEQLESIDPGFLGNKAQISASVIFAEQRSFLPFDVGVSIKVETGFKDDSTGYFMGLRVVI